MPKQVAKVLTDAMVRRIKPASDRLEVPDLQQPGLRLIVQPTGRKSWAVRYRLYGRPGKYTIGEYPTYTLAEARTLAEHARKLADKGVNPTDEKHQRQEESKAAHEEKRKRAFATVADLFVERYAKRETKRWRETQRILDKYVKPEWERKDIQDIKRADIVDLLDGVEDGHGPIMANRTLAAVRKLFNWAMVDRGILDTSPVGPGMSRANERKRARQRWLRDEEIKGLWNACDKIGWPFGPFTQMLLVTGQRRQEVASMRWSDVDLEKHVWTIPREFTKTDQEHEVPLSGTAARILEGMPRIKGTSHVFTTGRRGDKPVGGFSQAMVALRKHFSADERWTMHDLRRTFSTHAAEMGIPRLTISRVLNHAEGGTTAIYDRHSYLPEKRRALNAWAQKIEGLLRPDESGKVVPLHG